MIFFSTHLSQFPSPQSRALNMAPVILGVISSKIEDHFIAMIFSWFPDSTLPLGYKLTSFEKKGGFHLRRLERERMSEIEKKKVPDSEKVDSLFFRWF